MDYIFFGGLYIQKLEHQLFPSGEIKKKLRNFCLFAKKSLQSLDAEDN